MLRNFSIKARLLCGLSVLSMLSMVSSIGAIVSFNHSKASIEVLYQQRLQGMALLDRVKVDLFSMQSAIMDAGGSAPADGAVMRKLASDLQQTWNAYRALPQSATTGTAVHDFQNAWAALQTEVTALAGSDGAVSIPALQQAMAAAIGQARDITAAQARMPAPATARRSTITRSRCIRPWRSWRSVWSRRSSSRYRSCVRFPGRCATSSP